eukprot:552588-Pyramimonas_sp.AAC.1
MSSDHSADVRSCSLYSVLFRDAYPDNSGMQSSPQAWLHSLRRPAAAKIVAVAPRLHLQHSEECVRLGKPVTGSSRQSSLNNKLDCSVLVRGRKGVRVLRETDAVLCGGTLFASRRYREMYSRGGSLIDAVSNIIMHSFSVGGVERKGC